MGTVVVDLGSSTVKCGLAGPDGRVARRTARPMPTELGADSAEVSPAALTAAVREAVRELLVDRPAVSDVVITGQMGSHVWVDDGGRPVGKAVLWSDRRDMPAGTALMSGVNAAWFSEVSGQRYPTLAARSRWGEQAGRRGDPVPLRQWLVRVVTGRWCIDPTDASVTGCLDIRAARWSEELGRRLPVPARSLLPLRAPDEVIGPVTGDGAALLGLPAGASVRCGAGDGPCASLGAGATGADACLTLGSGGTLRMVVDEPVTDRDRQATCLAFGTAAGRYVISLPVSNVGFALEWARRTLGFDDAAELDEAARSAPVDPGLVFLPYLAGERFPYWDRGRTAGLTGLRAHHDRADIARAVLVSIGCCLRRAVEHVLALGVPIAAIRVNGGAARFPGLLSLLAATIPLPLRHVTAESLEGAALLAGGTGEPPAPGRDVAPADLPADLLDLAYERFIAASEAAPGQGRS
ncbi:xylulokinase [Pseudonocardia acaciae]|uniref:xylulokinase n=1 Tax=Pseudonocardia acaciae TaxID=551276 RepID=UPI0004907DB3|nr:FGGY-family carbohydrate kinase [Pseudonocardia acaciae]